MSEHVTGKYNPTHLFQHHLDKGTRLIFVLLVLALYGNQCNHDVVLLYRVNTGRSKIVSFGKCRFVYFEQ